MSPFAEFLLAVRTRRALRQADLAALLHRDQSQISALEHGLKRPSPEFIDRLASVLSLTPEELAELQLALQTSERKFLLDRDAPADTYRMINELHCEIRHLTASQVDIIRQVIAMREPHHRMAHGDDLRSRRSRRGPNKSASARITDIPQD